MTSRHTDHDERHDQRGGRSLKRVFLTYLPPWVGWLLLGAAAVAAHLTWGDRQPAQTLVALLLFGATCAGVAFTRKLAHARGEALRVLAGGTVAFGGAWTVLALPFAPWSHPWLDLYVIVGPIDCVLWNIYRALMSVKTEGQPSGVAGKLLEVINGAKLRGVEVEKTRVGEVIHAKAEVNRGEQTQKDLMAVAEHIEALAGLRRGSVLITPNPKDAGDTDWIIIPTDTLDREMGFTLSRPGQSIAEPIDLGIYLDGREMSITLPGSEKVRRNLAHILINAVTGGGKTELVRQFMAKVLTRTEVVVIGSDPVKGLQTMGPFAETDALELLSLDEAGSREMLKAVKRSIPARGAYLGKRGFKQWEPGCGLAFLVIWLEEATWATQSNVLIDLAAQLRSVGGQLVISQQRSSYTQTDTDLRANLQGGISGGLASAMDAKFNLPDDLVDMVGDTLESWGANKPGYFIANHPSIPDADRVKPWRSEIATDAEIREALIEFRPYRAVMDEVTRAAFGDTYDKLRAVMTGADPAEIFGGKRKAGQAVATTDDEGFGRDDDDEDPAWDEDEDDQEDDEMHDDPPPGPPIDPKRPVAPMPAEFAGLKLGEDLVRGRELSTEEARSVVQRHLRAVLDDGRTETTSADIYHMGPPTTGRGSEWVRLELYRLEREAGPGEIATRRDRDNPKPGVFEILEPMPAAAALDAE